MMAEPKIEIPRVQIDDFCRRWKIVEFSLFGSVLRDDFRPDSDVDVLVAFAPGVRLTLFDLGQIQQELEAMFGRPVDLVEREGLEESHNYIRRKHILGSLQPLYVSR